MKKLLLLFALPLSVSAYDHNTWDYPLFHFDRHEINPSQDFYQFDSNLRKDQDVLDEFTDSGILSYLLFENNQIVIDENKYYDLVGDGPLPSHSMGKSLVSYVTGHAICNGDIASVDEKLDWDVLNNTLFYGQPLINLLNMRAGDQNYVGDALSPQNDNLLKSSRVNSNLISLEDIMNNELSGSKLGNWAPYNYSALTTHVIFNYVLHKSGDDILNKVFTDHVKVKNNVYFTKTNKGQGQSSRYSFYADRYDYLRIARTIMNDWHSDTCIGNYLRTVYDRRISKENYRSGLTSINDSTKNYGGQFHFDIYGMEDRTIIGMSGFACQDIMIDVTNNKIMVINSKSCSYDWKEIAYEKF
mgnify:CR=1 FL=1|jgi:hypothetical protein